ncbi:hypothetical protein F4806DRAFT_470476 [Annulohypoxylon nitens]|nr:hypothetical protein F4806DRAFT_470476 [Annulohypoxylon nitens]
MDPSSLDPRLRDPGDGSIVVNGPTNPTQQQIAVAGIHASSQQKQTQQQQQQQQQRQRRQSSDIPDSPLQQQFQAQSTGPSPVASATGYTPHTPNGHHQGNETPNDPANTPQDPNDLKRPRACEACRGLKVKCEPDPANPEGPCKRCAKAGRNCIVTQPTRKRQKKTDSRVAELEKKIDALTASLHASRGGPNNASNTHSTDDQAYGYNHDSTAARDWGAPPSRSHQSHSTPELEKRSSFPPPTALAGQKRKFTESSDASPTVPSTSSAPPKPSTGPESEPDIIDRGIITMSEAAAFFTRFTDDMVPHLPAVVFPEGTTAIEIRKSKPILFLSIMAAASSEIPKLQRQLVREIMQLFAEHIIISGRKSLELIQALLVSVIWYYPPEHFEELKFYQFVHLAAVMSIDIGLGRKKHNPKTRLVPYTWRDHPFRKQPLPDPMSVEARRTWLAVYFLASNVSMALHRPNLIRWQPFMTECMDILESSPDTAPTDRYLCHLVWTHRLAEDVGIQFSMDDPSVFVNVSEQKVQYALRGFERDLAKYSESIPKSEKRPSLILGFHVLNLYMHEIALHVDKSPDEYRPPCNADSLREPIPGLDDSLTPSHISALSSCLTAIDGIFETFLSMDVHSIRCIPIFSFVRVAYAVVVLIKMYFSASNSNSELGKVINKDNMKVAEYLEKLLEKFREVAASDKSRPASKFLLVLAMLRSWFFKQGQAQGKGQADDEAATAAIQDLRGGLPNNEPKSGSGPSQHSSQQQHQPQPSNSAQTNTPLQLLSEIATGNGPARNNSQNPGPDANATQAYQSNAGWLRSVPQPAQPFMYDPTGANAATASRAGMPGPGPGPEQSFMPWMAGSFGATDFDYNSLGDGFEQAMGLTLTGFGGGSPGDPASYEDTMRYMMQNDMLGPLPVEGFTTAPQGPQTGPNGTYYPF